MHFLFMKRYHLKREITLDAEIGEVFAFFSNAENLELLTPQFLRFKILTPLPIEMKVGTIIEYQIQLFKIPFHWRTRITEWENGRKFVDVQERGPYKLWHHEHLFFPEGDKTRIVDIVEYELYGGVFAPLVHLLFVRRQVERIFNYRNSKIVEIFGKPSNALIAQQA